ncbi:MAG: arginyltransferase, partial [Lysobacterales bacterium CG_4_9_14_3_um_filter_62_6]
DVTAVGLSAVYTFFDPAQSARGLGVYAILAQIEWTKRLALPHLYLGYWIDGHPKMHYKNHYRPIECWREGRWQQLAV